MKKLRIGIIGTGGIARSVHIPAFIEMDDVEIVALCDIDTEKPKKLKEQHKINTAGVYDNYEDVLTLSDLDAVDICTPNYLHSIIAVKALNKGLHVFCEKPDAISGDEALSMKEATEKSGKTLMVMRNNRYISASAFLKKYIADGKMGDIYAGRCGWIRRRGIPGKGGWFTTKALSGGGPLIDLGVHMLDLSIWLMGNPRPVSVSGLIHTKFADNSANADSAHAAFGEAKEEGIFDVEDHATGLIRFDNGASLQIEFSWASNIEGEDAFVELRGTKAGSAWHSNEGSVLKIFSEENGAVIDILPKLKSVKSVHGANLRHFADVVLNGATPDFVPLQGVDMIKILEAVYTSAKLEREVVL